MKEVAIDPPLGDPSLLVPGERLIELFDGAFCTEGVAVAPDGTVYFSDITNTAQTGGAAGNVWAYDPSTDATRLHQSPSGMANGRKFDARGDMWVAEGADFGGRRITRTDMDTGRAWIVTGLFNGRPYNSPNDLAIDTLGRVFFTDPRYDGHEPIEQPVQGVYRIDPDGSVALVIADVEKPNGVAVTPDRTTLYVSDFNNGWFDPRQPPNVRRRKGRMALVAYDLSPAGDATFREVVVDFGSHDGVDGFVLDERGELVCAVWDEDRPSVRIYAPDGTELASIPTPVPPTNVCFGRGERSRTLYITGGAYLWRIDLAVAGGVTG